MTRCRRPPPISTTRSAPASRSWRRPLEAGDWDGETVQAAIFATATALDLPAGRAFIAIYLAFLGRPSGPRAGWLLAALDRDFVIRRLREAAGVEVKA